MSDDRLTTIATFPDEGAAAIAKSVLSAAGIPAVALDGSTTTTLWHVGTALGGVKLQVPASHAEAAQLILDDEDAAEGVPQHPWSCPRCHADVDAGFAICWQCGASAPDDLPTANPQATQGTAVEDHRVEEVEETPEEISYLDELPTWQLDEDIDDLADRAWRAALISAVLPIVFPYAGFLVSRLVGHELKPPARRKFYGALAVVVLVFLLVFFALNTLWLTRV